MRTFSFQNFHEFTPQNNFEVKVYDFCEKWRSNSQSFTFFTSGSTGEPKKIILAREQLENSAKQTISWLKLKENQVALLCISPEFIGGAMVLVRAMMAQMDLLLIEPQQDVTAELISCRQSIHLASFVPNQWKILLNSKIDLNSIFKNAVGVLIGGADLDLVTKNITHNCCQFPVYLTYGMTETVSHIAFQSIGIHPTNFLETLPFVKIRQTLDGKLCIASPSTWQKWIETEDLVEIIESNKFLIKGRANRIINSAGLKINPKALEEKLDVFFELHELQVNFFVAGVADDFFGEVVSIFVEGSQTFELNKLNDFLIQFFEKNKLPKRLYQLETFEKTPSGKIDQQKTIGKALTI